jgi:hypothetical protein
VTKEVPRGLKTVPAAHEVESQLKPAPDTFQVPKRQGLSAVALVQKGQRGPGTGIARAMPERLEPSAAASTTTCRLRSVVDAETFIRRGAPASIERHTLLMKRLANGRSIARNAAPCEPVAL